MRSLFGTDGIRGIANEFLSAERAMAIGKALGQILSCGTAHTSSVLIGMDTRISCGMLSSAITSGLLSMGCDVIVVGVLPTPALAYLVRRHNAKAAVMISASHNPYEYNGIKIFGQNGFKLSDEAEERIESIVLDGINTRTANPHSIGKLYSKNDAKDEYIDYLISTCTTPLDGLKIAVDAANGAASVTAKELFEKLGAEASVIFNKPDGMNINAKCGSTDLEALKAHVISGNFDVGIAFDGDADRCLALDSCGNVIDGDFIMAIIAEDMMSRGELNKNTVVGTVMTNLGFRKFCEENGINFVSTKVGDRYVLEAMNQGAYSLGGEQSGHLIMRKHSTTGDGQLTALTLLSIIKKSGKSLKELSAIMKKFPQHTENIPATQNQKNAFLKDKKIKFILDDAKKQLLKHGRIVARPSGTEPLIRITIECDEAYDAKNLARDIADKIVIQLKEYKN